MASRVTVTVNVRDESRRGIAALRRQIRQARNDIRRAGGTADFRISLNANSVRQARIRAARLRRALGDDVTIRTRVVPPPPNRVRRSLVGSLTSPFRTSGRLLGGTLSDGIGQGISNGFRGAGPIAMAAMSVLIASILAILGAALAGALVLAIGGAFVAAGVMAAFQADKVRKKWTDTLKQLKPLFQDAAEGLLPVIEHARQRMIEVAQVFAPHFKQALTAAAPHIQTFMDHIQEGFRLLGEKAAGPLEQAFNVFLDALGPEMEGMLSGLGDSLTALANTVSDHSTEIAQAFRMVIGLITTAIDVVNFLAQAWVFLDHAVMAAIGRIIQGMATVVDLSLSAVQRILEGFSHIPFIGKQFETAATAVGRFKDKVVADMRRSGQAFLDAGANLDRLNKERKLTVNIKSWQAQLEQAKAKLKSVPPEKRSKLRGDIADLQAKIAAAKAQLAGLKGKTIYINTVYSDLNRTKRNPSTGKYYRANGGTIPGMATGGARSNMAMVGEQGPELVDLPPGSRVHTNSDSRRIGMGGGGGMEPFVILLDVGGDRLAEVLVDPLRRTVSRRGGVQATFGKL